MGNDVEQEDFGYDAESRFNHLARSRVKAKGLEDDGNDGNFGDWALGTDYFSIGSYMPN